MILGAHVSIAGGVHNAIKHAEQLGCETFQIFTKNQNQWKEKIFTRAEINQFFYTLDRSELKGNPLAAHAGYLINLCSPDDEKLKQSREAFHMEIERCANLGLAFLIFHPGAHLGEGVEWAIEKISESLIQAIKATRDSNVRLLVETTAGQGTNLGSDFLQLAQILNNVNDSARTGVCLDTCHIFAAGYDMSNEIMYNNVMDQFEQQVGLNRLYAFHLNDSKKRLASHVDRHERIGEGEMGNIPFQLLVNDKRFKKIPGYLEVPGGDNAFISDLQKLKSFRE
jgi:deoxyribonuclease-4